MAREVCMKIDGLDFEVADADEGPMTWDEAMKPRKDGWRLPPLDELHQLYLHKAEIPNLTDGWYWSSTESYDGDSWIERFSDGIQTNGNENYSYVVRCVRSLNHSVISEEIVEKKKDNGGAAFPDEQQDGMTLRDYFAGMALQGILASFANPLSNGPAEVSVEDHAGGAYKIADAMLKARKS
jgi:hypothetical protein